MNHLNIHWICPAPSHYHAYFFNELSKDPDVSLEVHFLMESYAPHPWQMKPEMIFRHRVINTRLGIDFRLFRLALDRSNRFVISGWNRAFLVLFIMWLAILRREFLFWSDTANLSKKWYMPRRLVRNAAARIIFHSALKVLGTGRPGVEAFATMGCPTDKLVSFPYFAPIQDSYRSPKEKSAENPTIIVSLGRLDNSSKGFDIGLQALARLKRLKGLSSFQYLICGVGPDLERIRNQVDELGLSENVRFLGWLEVAEVKQILDVAHILLHPARYEPYGVAVLEAMISGVVVIGSEATCAVQDRILNGENGFVHAVGDVNTIAEQLSLILTDRERLLRMGMAARRTAEEWPASRGVEIIKSAFRD